MGPHPSAPRTYPPKERLGLSQMFDARTMDTGAELLGCRRWIPFRRSQDNYESDTQRTWSRGFEQPQGRRAI